MNHQVNTKEVRDAAMSPNVEYLQLLGARVRQLVLYIESFGLPVPAANVPAVKEGSSDKAHRENLDFFCRRIRQLYLYIESFGLPVPSPKPPNPRAVVAVKEGSSDETHPENLQLFASRVRQLVLYIESFGLPVPAANAPNPQNGVSPTPRPVVAVKEGSSDDTQRANEGAQTRSKAAPAPSVAANPPHSDGESSVSPPPELTSPSVLAFCNRGD